MARTGAVLEGGSEATGVRGPSVPSLELAQRRRRFAWEDALASKLTDLRQVPAGTSAGLVLLALVLITLAALAIDVRTGASVATFGWLYLLVILPVTLRWGRAAGLLTAGATLLLLVTFLTEPRGLPYTKSGADLLRLGISMGGLALAVLVIDQVNRSLASRDRILATIAGSVNEVTVSEALDGTILGWSKGAERLFGFTSREVVGKPRERISPLGFTTELADAVGLLQQGARVAYREAERLTRDGRTLDVALIVSPLRDSTGILTGVTTLVRDITARTRVERALRTADELLAGAVEQVDEGVLLFDSTGAILLANPYAQSLLRGAPKSVASGSFADLFGRWYSSYPPVSWARIVAATHATFLAIDTTGASPWLRAEVSQLQPEQPFHRTLYVMTIRDATHEVEEVYEQLTARATDQRDLNDSRPPTASAPAADVAAPREGLTSREIEVLALLADGCTNLEISERLGITVNTVERHVANIYRKLQIRSRVHATTYALEHGLSLRGGPRPT